MAKSTSEKNDSDDTQDKSQGRRVRYNKRYHDDIAYKAGLLLGDKQKIADFLDISKQTLLNWEKKYPSFKNAILDSMQKADCDIVQSLFLLAKGGIVRKTTVKTEYTDAKTRNPTVETKQTEEILPPNYKAIEFILRNRQKWKSSDFVEDKTSNQGSTFILMPSERF